MTFIVGALKGNVSAELVIEHVVHLAIGDLKSARLAPGSDAPAGTTYHEVVKAADRKSGRSQRLGFNAKGQPVEPDKELFELEDRRFAKFGRLSETLYNKLETLQGNENVDIWVFPFIEFDLFGYEKPTDREITEPLPQEKESLERVGNAHEKAVESIGGKIQKFHSSPAITTTLSVDKVRFLATLNGVGYVDYDDTSVVLDLATSLKISRADQSLSSTGNLNGFGVKVAVWEQGPTALSNLVFEERYSNNPTANSANPGHAVLTNSIIKNTEPSPKPNGYAPACKLYGANDASKEAFYWAHEQGCRVISQSFHRLSEATSGDLQSMDINCDFAACSWPYPLIVHSAGNMVTTDSDNIQPQSNEYVNHKGFNVFTVGNHNDTATAIDDTSVFRNPDTTLHNDRELPNISANGTVVSANGQSQTGTSFAAPAVAGTAALLIQANGLLKGWPESTRAILLASAGRRANGLTWFSDIQNVRDVSDGSGALHSENARTIAMVKVGQDNFSNPEPRGWGNATLKIADTDSTTTFYNHSWYMRAPRSGVGAASRKFKVALAWDSTARLIPSSADNQVTVDLDLLVYDTTTGLPVGFSSSYDNSQEIVDFQGVEDRTYQIKIRRTKALSNTEVSWVGVAWRNYKIGDE